MSTEETDKYVDWLEKSIINKDIKYYEYSEFKNMQPIGSGSYGSVFRANRRNKLFPLKPFNDDKTNKFALKSFNDDKTTLKQVINEIKLLKLFHQETHKNILKFYGITKIKTDIVFQINKYCLVLEYAENGTLNNYLNEHFNELIWDDKLSLASQLTSALLYLHEKDIIHRDLHDNNILVHRKEIKIADFGLSKKIAEASSNTSKIFGIIPYVDPNHFNQSQNYKLREKSDIYSIGVLMWQISSGYRPFFGVNYDISLALTILNGKREEIIEGTPVAYSSLYTECWKYEPDERPSIQVVDLALKEIISSEKGNNLLEKYQLVSNSFNESNDLAIDNTQTSTQPDVFNEIIVKKLITIIIRKHDHGTTFDKTQQLINQQISQLNQDTEKLIDWLSKNQTTSKYIWFFGLFYYYNIGVKEDSTNSIEAFKLFSTAAADNYPIAQVYLAKCYNDGYGIEQNKDLAFNWYQKAVANNSIIGQFYLGYCYEFGIGIKKDNLNSVYWYQKAANNKNTAAKLYLANCYRLGKGVEKDEIKAFKYYEFLAKQEIADAQQLLGNCFYYGIGTKADKNHAFFWYTKATKNENVIAKEIILKKYKDKNSKTNKGYMLPFSLNNLNKFSLYYVGKILMKASYEKAFYYLQKAAENGNKLAQYYLGNCYKNGKGVKKDERKAFELYQKSAKQGCINAQIGLGCCYAKGIGIDVDKVKAFEFYRIAAEKEYNIAQYSLGILYENGEGTEKNLTEAIHWFNKAAKNGNSNALNNLGEIYELGKGVDKDEIKAFAYYKKSAEKGNINAKFQLGYCYINGIGTEINKEKGFKSYNKAAGKKNDTQEIKYLYQKAAENNNKAALYNLGRRYELGQGVYQSEIRAFEFYKKSADQEFADAQYKVGYFYDHGIGVDIDKQKAFELYRMAAKENYDAQMNLALLYEQGEGTNKSIEKAIYWYKKAVKNGCQRAKESLDILLKQERISGN